ncbi:MAG: amidohydrolase [Chloroflexi bacterium]|nr:MAG: amidohydrolase [Chloroflexota bacterium]
MESGRARDPDPLVVAGGPILTMADPERVEAIAVRGDRILHAGSLADCRAVAGRRHQERDLGGRTLIPGFVDAHIHPLMFGQTTSWTDVGPQRASSIDALIELLAGRAAELEPRAPLWAYGYDQRQLAERRHPTAADLDRAAPGRAVYVMHSSGHGAVVSSAALDLAGINATTPDVPGGEIGRDSNGMPDGRLMDAAWDLALGSGGVKIGRHGPNIHVPDSQDALLGHLQTAQDAILRSGITTVFDAQVTRRELETYLRLRETGRLAMRVHLMVISSLLDDVLELGLVAPLGDEWLRFAAIKLYADGTLIGRTAYFPDGYPGEPDEHGLLYHDPAEYKNLLGRAHAAGLQTGTHALSAAAIGLVLDAIEEAASAAPRPDARHRIEHCALPTDEQIARMAKLGVIPIAQSQHMRSYGDGALSAAGQEVGERYHPLGLFARAGIRFALSSDAPVAPPAPLVAIQAAAERRTVLGTTLGGAVLRVDALRALQAYTIDAARAGHVDGYVGSLEPSKLADFAILDQDPTQAAAEAIGSIVVKETWAAGEQVA